MASIRRNTYKPDPYLAKAAENIAGLFAPPSGTDAAGWANANAKRAEAARIAELYAGAAGDTDRQAVMAGLYNPTQSYYAQNQNNATTIRGQDVTASTSMLNNRADNERALATNAADNTRASVVGLYGALNPGQVRPEVPAEVARTVGLPTIAAAQGMPKPLTDSEVKGAIIGSLPVPQQQGLVLAGPGTQNVMRDGAPVVESNAGAIGLAPQPDPQKVIKPTNGQFSLNGRMGPAVQDVTTGKWREAQTGAELPAEAVISNLPTPQGSNAEVGLGKPAQNDIEKQLIDTAVAKDTAVTLRKLIAESPAAQGIVGTLRGTAQNLLQSGGEVGSYFGGRLKAVDDAIKTGAADAGVAGAFDPNIPAIDMLSNLLAFQYAKTTTGERLSNEMLRSAKTALGLDGLDANQANSLARINQAIAAIERQEGILNRARGGGVAAISAPAPAAPVATSVAPAGGRMRFDANGNPL